MAQKSKRQIIDTHIHILNISHLDYHWLSPTSPLYRDIDISEIDTEITELDVEGFVLIEATNTAQEVDFLLAQANTNDRYLGVIAWLDINHPSVGERIKHYAKNPYFKGIRINYFSHRSNLDHLSTVMQALSDHHLVLDILMKAEYSADIAKLAALYPDIIFVLNHLAGIPIAESLLPKWQNNLRVLSEQANIILKISHHIVFDNLKAVIDHLIKVMKVDRLLFGSNFPMFITENSYTAICSHLIQATDHLIESERHAILHDNALRIYQLTRLTEA